MEYGSIEYQIYEYIIEMAFAPVARSMLNDMIWIKTVDACHLVL